MGIQSSLGDVNSSACACGIKMFKSSITDIHQVFDTAFSLNLEVTNYQTGRSVSPHHFSPALRTGNTGMGYYTCLSSFVLIYSKIINKSEKKQVTWRQCACHVRHTGFETIPKRENNKD